MVGRQSLEQLGGRPLGHVEPEDEQPVVAAVEGQVDRHRVVVPVAGAGQVEHRGVHVGALGEAPALGVELAHLGDGPVLEMVGVVALLHPVDGHVAAGVDGVAMMLSAGHRRSFSVRGATQRLPAKSQGPTMQPA